MITMTIGDIRDTRGDGCNLLASAYLFGTVHHIGFIRVHDDKEGIQVAFTEEDDGIFEDIARLYDFRFETVNIPGYEGEFVAYLHPSGI
jgi:hypothetical protein